MVVYVNQSLISVETSVCLDSKLIKKNEILLHTNKVRS